MSFRMDVSNNRRKVNIDFYLSAFCFLIFCIPRNRSAYPEVCHLLSRLDILSVLWTGYVFVNKGIYRDKWLKPIWGLLIIMILCCLINDPQNIKDLIILVYSMFGVVVLTEHLFILDKYKGLRWVAMIWATLMIVQAYSYATHCFGNVSTDNTFFNDNYLFGIRVEINEYIIYTIAFCWFAVCCRSMNIIYAIVGTISGIYFVISENVSTSFMGLMVMLFVLVLSWIIKSKKMWRNLTVFLVVFILLFAYIRNTDFFSWLLIGVLKEDLTLNGRTELWAQAIKQMQGFHWLFGYGYSPEAQLTLDGGYAVNHPHNQYLQMLYDYGIGGAFVYLFMIYKMITAIKGIENRKLRSIHIATLIGTLVMCISSRNFFYLTAQIYYVIVNHLSDYRVKNKRYRINY